MKVFFDFYEISLGKGKSIGIYNYAIALLKQFFKNPNIHLIVACSGENKKEISQIIGEKKIVVTSHYPTTKGRILWRLFKAINLAKQYDSDIYFSPKGFAPGLFKRKKKPFIVLTIHDMIPFYYKQNYPKLFGRSENVIITSYLKQSVKISNEVITISNFSKKMIESYAPSKTKVTVIYNGVDVKRTLIKQNGTKYIFAITSNLPHKNKENIIAGYLEYCKIVENPLRLIICGIRHEDVYIPDKYKSLITCILFADSTKFAELFSNASAFLFLPRIEGFGFPPLEALMYEVPPIVSDIPVLREVLGKSAIYVDHEQPSSIANGIKMILSNKNIANDLVKNGEKTFSKFEWLECSNKIEKVFQQVVLKNNRIQSD